jgi:nucleoside triphosphate pyrophosphatase
VPHVEELEDGDPAFVAVENARRKAQAVLRAGPVVGSSASAAEPAEASRPTPPARSSLPVLGVDTVVALEGRSYGKPADAGEARATLLALSGRVHEVISGIAVVEPGGVELRTRAVTTRVAFRQLDPDLIDWYVASEEWRERAGGYAIQGRGAALVAGIEGDYLNVVGLPAVALLELLPGILHPGG